MNWKHNRLPILSQLGLQTSCCSTSSAVRNLPLTSLSEDELMMKETVAKLANQEIAPYVKQMDSQQSFVSSVVDTLFSNGVILIFTNSLISKC